MRKITLLFLMLFCVLTIWAQTSYETSTADSPKYYTIGSYNRGGYLTNMGVGSKVEHVNLASGSVWYFVEADENNGVYIINALKDGDKAIYLGSDNTASTTAAVWYIISNGINENGLVISSTNPISSNSCIDANNNNTGVGNWTPDANDWEGTAWVFAECGSEILAEYDSQIQEELDNLLLYKEQKIIGKPIYDETNYNSLLAAYNIFKASPCIENYIACIEIITAMEICMPEVGKIYQIEAPLFYNTQGVHKALYSDGNNPNWGTLNKMNLSFYWTPVATNKGLAWQNVNDKKYILGQTDSYVAWTMVDTADNAEFSIAVITDGGADTAYQYAIIISGRHMHANNHEEGYGEGDNIVSWETNYANTGSSWTISEVELPNAPTAGEIVDLGLSVKWASSNIGATTPEEYGTYFQWSNVDIAQAQLGGNWYMPTMEEGQELIEKCEWVWSSINNINGYVVFGPNGNSIFLPVSGWVHYSTKELMRLGSEGNYWTSTQTSNSTAYDIEFLQNGTIFMDQGGVIGGWQVVRPVYRGGDDDATSIDAIIQEPDNETTIYNLYGERITRISKAGIYIVNGKKIIVK